MDTLGDDAALMLSRRPMGRATLAMHARIRVLGFFRGAGGR
jgi:hypothetical protein